MNAGPGANARLSAQCDTAPLPADDVSPATLGMGMQLVRASNLTMSRFQLALQRGDKRLAIMAMDSLLDIDAEMECFVADLACSAANQPQMQVMASYLTSQKEAIGLEKHSLIGHIGKVEPIPQGSGADDRPDLDVLELSTADAVGEDPQEPPTTPVVSRWPVALLAICMLCVAVTLVALVLGLPSL